MATVADHRHCSVRLPREPVQLLTGEAPTCSATVNRRDVLETLSARFGEQDEVEVEVGLLRTNSLVRSIAAALGQPSVTATRVPV